MLNETLSKKFGNKIRVRACGLLQEKGKILLINHEGIGKKGNIWLPPGGAVEFGDSLESTLIREFKEETGLEIKILDQAFSQEYIAPPLHAIEFFFVVESIGGQLKLGSDPELSAEDQIISDLKFFDEDEINDLDKALLHHSFSCVKRPLEVMNMKTHLVFEEI